MFVKIYEDSSRKWEQKIHISYGLADFTSVDVHLEQA